MRININGKQVTAKTDQTGYFTYNYKTDRVGKNTATITYPGNTNFQKATATKTFNVKITSPIPTYITLNNIKEVNNGQTTTISGHYYYSNNIPLTQTTMRLNINGQTYTTKTDNNGYFTYNYKTNKAGTNTLTIEYPGNNNFQYASSYKTFNVKYPTVELNVYPVNYAYPQPGKQVGEDHFEAWYQTYNGQYYKGVHVDNYGYNPYTDDWSAPHYVIVDATFYFKNSAGQIYSDTYKASRATNYMNHTLVSGYTPYKVVVSYRKATASESKMLSPI